MAKELTVPRELTYKQVLFVVHYLRTMEAKQAALDAGYSPGNAAKYGHELMQLPHVKAAIDAAMGERIERTKIDADWVLRRLVDEADADLADILDDDGAVLPVKDWPKIWRKGLVTGIDVQEDMVEGVKVGQTVKLKLSERIKRIELIGKHIGVQAFKDQVEASGAITLNINQEDAEL